MHYRPEIDGLRAVAVLPVMLFHAGFQAFSGGYSGVDVFFVISGYLITSIILAEKEAGTFTLIGFYERRARRILPALFVVMIACLPFAWIWLLPGDMKDFSQSLVAVSFFASNVLFWLKSGYFDAASELKPLIHTWSLAVEEQYYLLFPVFLLLTWRMGKAKIAGMLAVLALISLALAQWAAYNRPAAAFYLLPTRGWELLVGVLVALYIYRAGNSDDGKRATSVYQVLSIAGVLLIVYAVFAFDRETPFPGVHALVPTLGTALVILFASGRTLIGRLLSGRLLVGVGLISYSAYLWHQPLYAFARHRSISGPDGGVLVALMVVALFLAYLTWKYVETPVRQRKVFDRRGIFTLAFVLSTAFAIVGLVGHFNGGFQDRFSAEVMAVYRAKDDTGPVRAECHPEDGRYLDPRQACLIGKGAKLVGALMGDSHADALSHELGRALGEANIGMKYLSYIGCPPVLNIHRPGLGDAHMCFQYNEAVHRYFEESKKHEYLVMAARWTLYLEGGRFDNGEGGIEDGGRSHIDAVESGRKQLNEEDARKKVIKERYKQAVLAYLGLNKTVILVYPIPEVGRNVPVYLAKSLLFNPAGKADLTTSYDVYMSRNGEVIRALDEIGDHPNLIRVRPDRIFCNTHVQGRCVTQLNGVPLYNDDDHLSNAGARLVVDEVMRHLGTL